MSVVSRSSLLAGCVRRGMSTAATTRMASATCASRFAVAPAGVHASVPRLPGTLHRSPIAVRTFRSSAVASSQGAWANKGAIDYAELAPIAKQPSGDVTLIDVREPDEVAAGMIPSAVSVPLTQFEKAFDPNAGGNFERDYAFKRPAFDDKVVFYCRSGKRSAQAQEIARRNGWNNTRNYEGSWLDWVSHEEKKGH